jgi:hypothetical protein
MPIYNQKRVNILVQALEDIVGRATDTTVKLHPDADAKGCVDDLIELAEDALLRFYGDANHEGWSLFDVNSTGLLEIQRDDEADLFESDEAAVNFVRRRANEGSMPHYLALRTHLRHAAIRNKRAAETGCPHCVQGYVQETGFDRCDHCNPEPLPTSRTEALMERCAGHHSSIIEKLPPHAKQLEREAAAWRAVAEGLVASIRKHEDKFPDEALEGERRLWESTKAFYALKAELEEKE